MLSKFNGLYGGKLTILSVMFITFTGALSQAFSPDELVGLTSFANAPNCWNTAFYLNQSYPVIGYMSETQTNFLFSNHCSQKTEDPQAAEPGQLIRIRGGSRLGLGLDIHAFIRLPDGRFFQKRAGGSSMPFEYTNLNYPFELYAQTSPPFPPRRIGVYSCNQNIFPLLERADFRLLRDLLTSMEHVFVDKNKLNDQNLMESIRSVLIRLNDSEEILNAIWTSDPQYFYLLLDLSFGFQTIGFENANAQGLLIPFNRFYQKVIQTMMERNRDIILFAKRDIDAIFELWNLTGLQNPLGFAEQWAKFSAPSSTEFEVQWRSKFLRYLSNKNFNYGDISASIISALDFANSIRSQNQFEDEFFKNYIRRNVQELLNSGLKSEIIQREKILAMLR